MRVPVEGLVMLVTIAALGIAAPARADAPAPELMARLATYGANFETMRARASFSVKGRYEELDGDGKTDSVKTMEARVDPDGSGHKLNVGSYMEDGKDKTEEARKDAREREEKQRSEAHGTGGSKKRIRIPILADEQSRYDFNQVEVDQADPSRVRIAFTPKVRGADTIEGSAWVDTRAGTLISAGFKLSKTPIFVDYVRFTVEFGAPGPLGPAISTISIEGKGGIPFFRKHFQARAMLSDYTL
jgi:hypothetical protein